MSLRKKVKRMKRKDYVFLKKVMKLIRKYKKELKKNGVKNIYIHGSLVNGGFNKESDIDLLINGTKRTTYHIIGIFYDLENIIGRRVDFGFTRSLNPIIKDDILKSKKIKVF